MAAGTFALVRAPAGYERNRAYIPIMMRHDYRRVDPEFASALRAFGLVYWNVGHHLTRIELKPNIGFYVLCIINCDLQMRSITAHQIKRIYIHSFYD